MSRILLFLLLFWCPFCAAQSVSFITFGDWGREGKYGQQETADAMGKYAEDNKTDFILILGDNFYPVGVKSIEDPHWKLSFENVYTAPSLQIPWYITLGNHDYGGNVQAQVDYSINSSRWKLPARYYSFERNIDEKTSALFVVIDTSPFIKSYLSLDSNNEELDTASVNDLRRQDTKQQLRWLDSILASSTAKWKIVAAHHPVYSGGEHGDTPELIDDLDPILIRYNVNLYLCGHDHDMQHIKRPGSNVHYMVAGSGSKLRKTTKTEYSLFAASENGFLSIKIGVKEIRAAFIGVDDSELYSYEIN
jgi:acid phosphatase